MATVAKIKDNRLLEEESLNEFKEDWNRCQNWLQSKTQEEIVHLASEMAKDEFVTRDWRTDPEYTELFIQGGICYFVGESMTTSKN